MLPSRGYRRKADLLGTFQRKGDIMESRIIAPNTLIITLVDGCKVLRFHDTDLLLMWPKGRIEILPHLWRTSTTKERINLGMAIHYDGRLDGAVHPHLHQEEGCWIWHDTARNSYEYERVAAFCPKGLARFHRGKA